MVWLTPMNMNKILLASIAVLSAAASSQAAIIPFDLIGTAGAGLLPGNEPGSITGGTGGEIGLGISYDTVTNILDLTNVGWGSTFGFSNLTSLANNSHIHGPTAANNGNNGVGDFRQTAGVLINLTRSTNATTGGVFTNPILDFDTLFGVAAETREAELLSGKYYINIHTVTNGGGELRGFLKPVPEPGTVLWGATLGLFSGFRRARARRA